MCDACDCCWSRSAAATACGVMTRRVCQAAGFTPRIRHVVDDFAAALALVAIGHGVALVPELGLDRRHRRVTVSALPLRRPTLAAFRAGAGGQPAIAAFIAAVHEAADERPELASQLPLRQ